MVHGSTLHIRLLDDDDNGDGDAGGGSSLLALVKSDAFEILAVKAKLKQAKHRLKCITEMLEFVRVSALCCG